MNKFEKFIRDNVHKEIYIDNPIYIELINTSEFQRLRRIIQLGGGQFVFPGANHTRFSHCIGVYHVVCKFMENEYFKEQISEHDKKIVKLAGLLHDLGHGPFSHTFESVSNQPHEQYTIDIIMGDTQINKVLKKYEVDPNEVISVIQGKHKNHILNLLVSSQLDADRLDYLLRDSENAGVNYSKLDIEWIIRNARIMDNKIVFPEKTINALEHYLLGRYHMFLQVYEHKVSIAFDKTFNRWFLRLKDLYNQNYKFKNTYFIDILKELLEGKVCSLSNYIRLDDYSMMEFLKICSTEEDEILKDLSLRIVNRNFLSISSSLSEEEFEKLKQNCKYDPKYYFGKEENKKVYIYKDSNSKKDENIYIVKQKDNKLYKLNELSDILNTQKENNKKNIFIFLKDNVE